MLAAAAAILTPFSAFATQFEDLGPSARAMPLDDLRRAEMDKIDDCNAAVRTGGRWHNIYEDEAPSAACYTTGAVKRLVEQRHPSGLGLPAELADAPSLGHVSPDNMAAANGLRELAT